MNIASEILEVEREISFDFTNSKGSKSTVKAFVAENSLTPKVFRALRKLEENKDVDGLTSALAEIYKRWDIDINGEDFPPTVENLEGLPFDFLTSMVEAVAEGWAGKSTTATKSLNGSAQTAK